MNKIVSALMGLSLLAVMSAFGQTADPLRQEAVRERSADVMPFDMSATTHIFAKTPEGGVQRVVVNTPGDTKQTALIRRHLRDIADRFAHGDFSAPTDVHGAEMPGLATLKAAAPGEVHVRYRDLQSGAEIQYSSLGRYPYVPLESAWARGHAARHFLEAGVDPGSQKQALRRIFVDRV